MGATRIQGCLILLALLALRVSIGYHFYSEGVSKLQSDTFSCAPFLGGAKGPLAPFFRSLIDDENGHIRLCLVPAPERGPDRFRIDTATTHAIWEDYVLRASEHFGLDTDQAAAMQRLSDGAKLELESFFSETMPASVETNAELILAWAHGQQRLQGFARDGAGGGRVIDGVESLNRQVATIRSERQRESAAWLARIEGIWDNLEDSVNEIGRDSDLEKQFQLDRPYREPNSPQQLIDRYLPWFDCVVGGLLILGLFSRLASLAGIALLMGVVSTQPPWVLGSADTFYQWIEIAGLFVVFATVAGRCGGLDYFFCKATVPSDTEESRL